MIVVCMLFTWERKIDGILDPREPVVNGVNYLL